MADIGFEEDPAGAKNPQDDDSLVLNIDGFEGPIDLLLTLSREQKVDLTKISILQLANQYIAFIERARHLSLEIAADYLVMAAWLAYLKSRLLLPVVKDEEGELSAAEMAARLKLQLQRLEAMRNVGKKLFERPQLESEFFKRGAPEALKVVRNTIFEVTLFDILKAYGAFRERENITALRIDPTQLYSTEKALGWLRQLVGNVPDWTTLETFLPPGLEKGIVRRSALAATFAASLELVKAGDASLRQSKPFAPLYLRSEKKSVAA
ncbi:MAG: ScpA family protein [Proteobacteria bacterium]|nr:ScpA family protein [Pseudomonadota bacterium]